MKRCDIFKYASATAYISFLSLVPSLIVIFSLATFFSPLLGKNSDLLHQGKDFILSHLATGSGERVISYLDRLLTNTDIGKIGITGFFSMVFTLVLLLRNVELALNRIFQVFKERSMIARSVQFWTFLTLGFFLSFLITGMLSDFDLLNLFEKSKNPESSLLMAQLLPGIAVFLFFSLLYKLVPNCYVKGIHAAWGSFFATLILMLAIKTFGHYTTYFTNYRSLYGTLAVIPIFILWIYIIWLITLLGAVITWRIAQGMSNDESSDWHHHFQSHYDTYQMKSILPVLITMLVQESFIKGRSSSINGHQIAHTLSIPESWVLEALGILREYHLIASVESSSKDSLLQNLYPTSLISDKNNRDIFQLLGTGSKHWFNKLETPIRQKLISLSPFFQQKEKD